MESFENTTLNDRKNELFTENGTLYCYCYFLSFLKNSQIRIQNNNWDTIIAMSQRSFGGAYQFVAPMSITYGLQECFSSKKIRI